MTKTAFCFYLIVCSLACGVSSRIHVPMNPQFQTGWWTDAEHPEYLATYADDGIRLVLANGPGWFTSPSERIKIKTYLDEAQNCGIKVILSMVRQRHTPYGIPVQEFVDSITYCKDHPALYAWNLGDEPELYNNGDSNPDDDWTIVHEYLATDPGYYQLAKSTDPSHPVLISFSMIFEPLDTSFARVANFLDVTEIIGMHNYPFYADDTEFAGSASRHQYDKWKYMIEKKALNEKACFIATAQGFGANPHSTDWRDPTYAELRHQVFAAIVLGVDKVLFWYDGWASPAMKDLVKRMIAEVQAIGAMMNNGVTNDPQVNVSITDRDQLVYRYGTSGSEHAILAINIANRDSISGATLSAVRFILPSDVSPVRIRVLNENRTLPVNDNSFNDSFAPFAVHLYTF